MKSNVFMLEKNLLKEVILLQREALNKAETGTSREKKDEIKIVDSFALIITGVRRCGKSTFVHQLMKTQKKAYYLNLEDPRLKGFDLSDFNKVEEIVKELYGESGVYFFDEIQNIPEWERFIRYLVDKKERVVVTGSNASILSRELGTKLTGRHLNYEMFPFSFKEFLDAKDAPSSIESFRNYLYKGGFPEFLKKDEEGNPMGGPVVHKEKDFVYVGSASFNYDRILYDDEKTVIDDIDELKPSGATHWRVASRNEMIPRHHLTFFSNLLYSHIRTYMPTAAHMNA